MAYLPDKVIDHLREAVVLPDFSATRYELLGEIGRGGMGTVYAGHDKQLDRRVALKVLNIQYPGGQAAERMAEEARVLARLEHPGIVPVHEARHQTLVLLVAAYLVMRILLFFFTRR